MYESMYEEDLVVGSMFSLELIKSGSDPSIEFTTFFQDNFKSMLEAIDIKWDEEYNSSSNYEIHDFVSDKDLSGFVIEFSAGYTRDFKFSEGATSAEDYNSYNITRSITTTFITHGATIKECVEKAILQRKAFVKDRAFEAWEQECALRGTLKRSDELKEHAGAAWENLQTKRMLAAK